jgi:hypothetical protein
MLNVAEIQGKILIIGALYDKVSKLESRPELLKNYQHIVINGNICFPFDDFDLIKDRISKVTNFLATNKVIYNLGSYDLKLLGILLESGEHKDIQNWILTKPNVVRLQFKNQSTIIVVNGGLPKKVLTQRMLEDNLEVSFVSRVDGKPWQNYYAGQLGYIISNYPLTVEKPTFYSYSMQLGTKYNDNMNIYAQEADQYGLKETILL